jgi:hypothetical protein
MSRRFDERVDHVRRFVDRLFGDIDATVASVVADGWPEAMVRRGFEMHRHTWDVDALRVAFEAEVSAFGGPGALEQFVADGSGRRLRLVRPESITHIWPALPGAGLMPVLYGALLGVPQRVRPSSRGRHFAEHVVDLWPSEGSPLALVEDEQAWATSEVIVVSGSDQTLVEVRRLAEENRSPKRLVVTGYGHRVSLAVVVDHDELDLARTAASLATDVVMWHQQGCFSARAVLFRGADERLEELGAALGQAIAVREEQLDAAELDAAQLSQRAQAKGVAEFTAKVWGEGIGWAQRVDGPFAGEQVAPHVVTLHSVESLDALEAAVDVPSTQLQGVALEAAKSTHDGWAQALARLGATRVCAPGRLQAPPAGWLHDGRPNVLEWLRVVIDG